ncbi:RagB/SusD family nutrient uptake outer membrane protein [Gaoshiqia sp. Z1-71]|uniref:RagB/SusD family nutrient uptake outer membrane protein n=1 Tax=Gaoshiqia hydrogeniformans TaxID=3290090 RepID=UPI003BF9272D
MKILKYIIISGIFLLPFTACEDLLDEPVYSQLAPENFLKTDEGIVSVLKAAYVWENNVQGQLAAKGYILTQDGSTDIMFEKAGADNRQMLQFMNFTWDSNLDWLLGMLWNPCYFAIRNANSVLDNIEIAEITDAKKSLYAAEARFVRAVSYYNLYIFFGPVPLRKTMKGGAEELARATDDEIKTFIETELLAVVNDLPAPGAEPEYGRANRGAARAFLCKYYLNTKQWQKCADMAQQIMDMNYYELYPNYSAMFRVENERNKEYMWVRTCTAIVPGSGPGNDWEAYVFPAGFQKDPVSGLTFSNIWRNYAAHYSLRDGFYNSFAPNDKRKETILTSYINSAGQTVSLLTGNDTRPLKYWPDPNAVNGGMGNDFPTIRYADILLARAEALNELHGPTLESVSLINDIRLRAGVDQKLLTDFADKAALRDHIIAERGWEFYCEGLRRQDLIRTGKYLSYALARGVTHASEKHLLFPIPQQAIDSDSKLEQNPGY